MKYSPNLEMLSLLFLPIFPFLLTHMGKSEFLNFSVRGTEFEECTFNLLEVDVEYAHNLLNAHTTTTS